MSRRALGFRAIVCWNERCGGLYLAPKSFLAARDDDGRSWLCPFCWGHTVTEHARLYRNTARLSVYGPGLFIPDVSRGRTAARTMVEAGRNWWGRKDDE